MAVKGVGNQTGPLYLCGDINVAAAGTPAPLNQNVLTDGGFGTAATPSPICANQIIFHALATNVGASYILLGANSTKASPANGGGIVKRLAPGETYTLTTTNLSNPFQLKQFMIDADTNANKVTVTAVIV